MIELFFFVNRGITELIILFFVCFQFFYQLLYSKKLFEHCFEFSSRYIFERRALLYKDIGITPVFHRMKLILSLITCHSWNN